ncbi:hypothetical protein [Desulfospira joergensenii]|uniref:hypothetical protein n=1 Tax=Desulfospira joergensenii TaxID=53329 RepID=UPI0003B3CA25|nr:hypothetical protein [Desulfospira joergensenii]
MKKILILLFVFLLTSCVHEKTSNFVDPSERINDVVGVSVLPPQEEGWQIASKNKTQLVLAKYGPTENSSYIANITIFKLPKFETEQQFTQYISEGKKAQQPEERFRVIQDEKENIKGGANYIMKYHTIAEDKVATAKYGNKTMILEVLGYTGQHPQNHAIGIELGYSYRYQLGNEDINFKEKANTFLDSIIITDL